MAKPFHDTFFNLELEPEIKGLLNNAEITKVSTNHDKTRIRFYLHASRLITKDIIWKLEKQITKQIFPGVEVQVKIIESFTLSEQYNLKSLLDVYFDSIVEELNQYSVLEANLLKTADMVFEQS